MRPPDLVLQETRPGYYETHWTVPSDVDVDHYEVRGMMRLGDQLYSAAAPIRIRRRAPIVIGPGLGPLPPPPHGQVRPVGPRNAPLSDLPAWADELATIIAYIVVFYGVVAGLHAVNIKGGWVVALAMLGVTWILRSYIVEPLAGLIRQIILAGFHVLLELVEFVAQWLAGIAQYFQGDVVRAITRILLIAAFLWVFELAQTIPVIRDILDTITETANRLLHWINDSIDGVLRSIRAFRDDVEGRFGQMLDRMGLAGQQLRAELISHVDSLFAGLIRHVGRVRNQLLARVEVIHTLAHARITLMGQTVAIAPRLVHDRIAEAYTATGLRAAHDTVTAYRALAARYSPEGAQHAAVWEIVDEFRAELAARADGFLPLAVEYLRDARADIRAVQAGTPPERDPWPLNLQAPEVDTPQPMPVSAGEYASPFFPPPIPPDEPPP